MRTLCSVTLNLALQTTLTEITAFGYVQPTIVIYCALANGVFPSPALFQVISPSSEHLFQALNEQQLHAWVKAMQEATEEALKNSGPSPRDFTRSYSIDKIDGSEVAASDVLEQVLSIPGNRQCADCSSTNGEQC